MKESPATERHTPAALLADVLWRRIDQPSLEHCRLMRRGGFNEIHGCVLTALGGQPIEIRYVVRCDLDWVTRGADVQTVQGTASRRLEMRRDDQGAWWRDGRRMPDLDGLVDVDLAVTPSTNTLPIRRLALDVAGDAPTDAVWVQFPSLSIDRLAQHYTRTAERRYRYASRGGSFVADLDVDDQGVVVRYGEIWERVPR